MAGLRMFSSCFRPPKRELQATESGSKRAEPQPAKPASKQDLPPLDPASLKRIKGRTVMLPSQISERPDVKPARPPVARPTPDAVPPMTFGKPPRKIFGITLPFQKEKRMREACIEKWEAMPTPDAKVIDNPRSILKDKEYVDILKERHPNIMGYGSSAIEDAALEHLMDHPRFLNEHYTKSRNELYSIPNAPTGSRTMKPGEQEFLTNAFHRINEEFRKNPLHIHGEWGITGNRKGEVSQPVHKPVGNVTIPFQEGDRYNLHTHPPYMQPTPTSASEADHKAAAELVLRMKKMDTYVSNGKDVMHIMPDSTHLIKLIPDPKTEKKLGAFPEAFSVPKPKDPPYPFANHEAPPQVKPWNREV